MEHRQNDHGGGEVLITMPNLESSKLPPKGSPSSKPESQTLKHVFDSAEKSASACSSPEFSTFSPGSSANRPPKIPTNQTQAIKRTLTRSIYSKPKSRFGEQLYPVDMNAFDVNGKDKDSHYMSSSPDTNRGVSRTVSIGHITPKTPLMASPGSHETDDEEIYKKMNTQLSMKKKKKVKCKVIVEWITFSCLLGCLIASLTIKDLKHCVKGGLEIWKWCVIIMVIFCGMFVTSWFMQFLVFLIERNFLLRKKVLYFVHGLKKSVQFFIWLCLILMCWVLLFKRGVERSDKANEMLNYVTLTIVTLLIGAFLWLVKTLLLKILASSFHVNTFFDRIQESIFHQYVLQTLSGPSLIEIGERIGRVPAAGTLSFSTLKKGKDKEKQKEKKVIDMGKIHQIKQDKVSAWTMKVLVDVISNSGLSTISDVLDETAHDEKGAQSDNQITNEMEAISAAYHIFRNVAQPGSQYIDEEDLMRFMIKEEIDLVFPLFDGYDTGRIDRKSLTDWVIKVYQGRKALVHALSDTKTAVKQLSKLLSGILIVVVIIIWLLLLGIATTKVLVVLSSQLVVVAFIFGNTCKTIFEAIIFVFVMHPFDVGDRCVIDGIQMVVEEMNILTTVFLKFDNEKIYYPNSVLATKPIGNFYRSPDMGDNVEFSIAFTTPAEKIGELKEAIIAYLEGNPQHWHPNHNLVVKEIENVNKLKMALFFNHTMNFQDYGEKTRRKTDLVMNLKRMLEEIGIRYDLLPQEVILRQNISLAGTPSDTYVHK